MSRTESSGLLKVLQKRVPVKGTMGFYNGVPLRGAFGGTVIEYHLPTSGCGVRGCPALNIPINVMYNGKDVND